MREAISATAFMQILIIFIIIFVSFLALSVNFAQAFRVKNKIISYIEANEGLGDGNGTEEEINAFLDEIRYTGRVSIVPTTTSRGEFYTVSTAMRVDIPIIGEIVESFDIKGETKIIFTRE